MMGDYSSWFVKCLQTYLPIIRLNLGEDVSQLFLRVIKWFIFLSCRKMVRLVVCRSVSFFPKWFQNGLPFLCVFSTHLMVIQTHFWIRVLKLFRLSKLRFSLWTFLHKWTGSNSILWIKFSILVSLEWCCRYISSDWNFIKYYLCYIAYSAK